MFYKRDEDDNLLFGNEIINKGYHLHHIDNRVDRDGWYWFDDVHDAQNFLYSDKEPTFFERFMFLFTGRL